MKDFKLNNAPMGGWIDQINDLVIPNDPANSDCQRVLDWIAAGNVPDPAYQLPAPGPDPTIENLNLINDMISAIDFGTDSASQELAGVLQAQIALQIQALGG